MITYAELQGIDTVASEKMGKALRTIDNRYGINISRLGWINCDRFYNPYEEKADYVVQLGDSAANYYTLLVFNNIKSVMNGYISGNTAIFPNVPMGMDVTMVSVGINKKGQAVYAMQKTVTDKTGLSGITFQPAEAAALPNALSKLDK
jgi:methionine synthase I (cobalamin-dependent)